MDKLKKLLGLGGHGDGAPPAAAAASSSSVSPSDVVEKPNNVILHTTLGAITIKLFADQTPKV
jgi:peptidyl-prolyl cis-trans isomerase-like 1